MLTTFQTKIDSIINQEYQNMPSQSQNEIISLIQYTKALDLFEFTSQFYHIQQTEIILNVSLYWETLGNSKQALEYLNRALEIVPNQPSLILYKSILLLSLNFPDESQRNLLRYKQLGRNNHCYIFYYDTFRIIFYYVLKYEDDVILSEINEFIAKYNTDGDNDNRLNGAFGTIHYIRALIYSNCALKQKREETKQLLIHKYEENINIAYKYQRSNTCYYIQEGIERDNLSKAFTIIFPYINNYKPKMLMNYQSIFQGFKLFYVLFKAVKLFNIKLKRKRIKTYYIQQLKISKKSQSKERDCSSESHEGNAKSTKRNTCDDSTKNKSNTNILRCKGKNDSSSDITDRNNSSLQCKRIEEIKNEFQTAIRNLYNSVWVYNYSIIPKQNANDGVNIDVNVPLINSNYFIRNGYYSPRNIKENILKGISNNEDYKSKLNRQQEKRVVLSHKANIKNTNKIINTINNNTNNNNSNSNAKTEPSAPSQISTYSNVKTGEETTQKIHQHKSTKEIKKIKSNIPLQLNYHTEMKSHSNERMRNNKSPSINLIDVSDSNNNNNNNNNDNDNPQISVKKNELIISRSIKKKIITNQITKIDISSNNRNSNNNQPPSIALGLKKNIPQSKAKPDILHLLSKKSSDINSNSSIEKYIKFSKTIV